jgi:protein fantom
MHLADEKELQELKVFYADTINELEKTRKLLQMQHIINKDYKTEVRVDLQYCR